MRIAKSVAELIGRTPMLELTHFEQTHCLNCLLYTSPSPRDA